MKKIFTLLSLLVLTLTAMATTFTGHRIVTVGYLESSEMDNATITVTDKGCTHYQADSRGRHRYMMSDHNQSALLVKHMCDLVSRKPKNKK